MKIKIEIRDTQKTHELILKDVDSFSYQRLTLRVYFLDEDELPQKTLEVYQYSPVYSFRSMPD